MAIIPAIVAEVDLVNYFGSTCSAGILFTTLPNLETAYSYTINEPSASLFSGQYFGISSVCDDLIIKARIILDDGLYSDPPPFLSLIETSSASPTSQSN